VCYVIFSWKGEADFTATANNHVASACFPERMKIFLSISTWKVRQISQLQQITTWLQHMLPREEDDLVTSFPPGKVARFHS
jgi:hypothetical protein